MSRLTGITRLAPSPTGALHLGNARTFLVNWALARQRRWRVVLRIEDLDSPRTKSGADQQAIDMLGWLGLDWDDGPHYQLADLWPYHRALGELAERGLIYRCTCTRSEIAEAQSAPHDEPAVSGDLRYPGTHRPPTAQPTRYAPDEVDAGGAAIAWRVRVPDEPIAFDDALQGPQAINVQADVGDFVVATKSGLPAYQLAVVVDDARQGVTDIVRGDDLLRSAPRQLLLYDLLGLAPPPGYTHLPLVLGPDGRRLAKRHGDTRLVAYREAGVAAERVVGLLGWWSGVGDKPTEMTAAEFARRFDLAALPPESSVFTQEDEAWLTART